MIFQQTSSGCNDLYCCTNIAKQLSVSLLVLVIYNCYTVNKVTSLVLFQVLHLCRETVDDLNKQKPNETLWMSWKKRDRFKSLNKFTQSIHVSFPLIWRVAQYHSFHLFNNSKHCTLQSLYNSKHRPGWQWSARHSLFLSAQYLIA